MPPPDIVPAWPDPLFPWRADAIGERAGARNSGGKGASQAQRKGLSRVKNPFLVLACLPPSKVLFSPFLELPYLKIHLLEKVTLLLQSNRRTLGGVRIPHLG